MGCPCKALQAQIWVTNRLLSHNLLPFPCWSYTAEEFKVLYDSHINLPDKCTAPKIDADLSTTRKATMATACLVAAF